MEDIPLSSIYHFTHAVTFIGGVNTEVSIDDLSVKIHSSQENENEWNVLFNEGFERFSDEEREQPKESGWVQEMNMIKEITNEPGIETDEISIDTDYTHSVQSLKIKSDSQREVVVIKSFQLPVSFPFDISDKPFAIKYNEKQPYPFYQPQTTLGKFRQG